MSSLAWAGLLAMSLLGCGGRSGPPQFNIASANWTVPLNNAFSSPPPGAFAGGLLTQSGDHVSGVLHIAGVSCFDPVADSLTVQGTVSGDPNAPDALMLTTSPVRGQVFSVNATWNKFLDPGLPPPTSPPNPVMQMVGSWTLGGGACAAAGNSNQIHVSNFNGKWSGNLIGPTWVGTLTATMSQTGPDAQGFSQVSGTFSVSGSPCFSSGTISSTTFAGEISQMTVTMDSGQLSGSAQVGLGLLAGANFLTVSFNFVVHGGACDGQSVTGTVS